MCRMGEEGDVERAESCCRETGRVIQLPFKLVGVELELACHLGNQPLGILVSNGDWYADGACAAGVRVEDHDCGWGGHFDLCWVMLVLGKL